MFYVVCVRYIFLIKKKYVKDISNWFLKLWVIDSFLMLLAYSVSVFSMIDSRIAFLEEGKKS